MKDECWVVTHDDNLVCVCATKEIALDNLIVLAEEFETEQKDYIIQTLTRRCNACKYAFGCQGYAAEKTLYFAE